MTERIYSLTDIRCNAYETIIWDISNTDYDFCIGGLSLCRHEHIDEDCRCVCGALVGNINDFSFRDYARFILTQLALSPATNTFLLSSRTLANCQEYLNFSKLPKYKEIIWLSKYGDFYDKIRQSVKYLIVKSNLDLTCSNVLVNPYGFDERLLNLGKTLCINVNKRWHRVSSNLTYL